MPKLPLSAFIITKNEERRIGEVLDSIAGLADEIIVVDSGSTDQTCEIARSKGAQVFFNEWPGYGQQKRSGEDHCSHDWLLNLDGDEVLTPQLAEEIRALFEAGEPSCSFYRLKVTTVFPFASKPRLWAEHNSVIRLYDKRVGRFPDHPTWDAITPAAGQKIVELNAPCLHFSNPGLTQTVAKLNDYTAMQSAHQPQKSYAMLVLRLFLAFPLTFFKIYVLKRYFTGGLYGFILAVTLANINFGRFAKMLERRLFEKQRQETE